MYIVWMSLRGCSASRSPPSQHAHHHSLSHSLRADLDTFLAPSSSSPSDFGTGDVSIHKWRTFNSLRPSALNFYNLKFVVDYVATTSSSNHFSRHRHDVPTTPGSSLPSTSFSETIERRSIPESENVRSFEKIVKAKKAPHPRPSRCIL